MSEYIIISDDLRTMQIPSSIVLLGVESDDDVNKISFQMPKEYCGFDLSTFSARINYMNANGDGDIYIVDDLAVDGDNMTFTWLVGRNACMYKGDTRFIVCLKLFDGDTVIKEFNTTVYSLPVLEGLETTEAVVQQNADIIQYLINLMEQSGTIDPSNYYTKAETDALIPTKLPNPESLTINGQGYDGSEPVDLTIEASSEVLSTRSGKVIHINDAVADEAIKSLKLYADAVEVASGAVAIANKNLFRIDLLASQVVSKGITFTKNADGSITCNGTSTGTYPMTSCALDKNMFEIGKTYCVSSGKTAGFTYVQLIINYADNTTDYIVARNSARAFTISKEVSSCTASVQLTDSGVTVNNEIVYPMLEIAATASAFVNNTYSEITFDGTTMPVLPAAICNVWANDDVVTNMVMEYEADTVLGKVDDYANDNLHVSMNAASVVAQHDGARTVSLMTVDEAEATLDVIDEYVESKKEEIDEYIAEVEGELGETVALHTEQIADLQNDTSRLYDKTSALQKQIDNITEAEDLLNTVNYPEDAIDVIPANVSKYAEIGGIKGKTRAWNQLVSLSSIATTNLTSSSINTTTQTASGTVANADGSFYLNLANSSNFDIVSGHKYLIAIPISAPSALTAIRAYISNWIVSDVALEILMSISGGVAYGIITSNASKSVGCLCIYSATSASSVSGQIVTVSKPILRDLTPIFPEGVPSTVAECVAKCHDILEWDEYDAGSLVSTEVSAVESIGVNIWDEEWKAGNIVNGIEENPPSRYRLISKNYCPCLPNTTYFYHSGTNCGCTVYVYDADKNYIGIAYDDNAVDIAFTTPQNAVYFKIQMYATYGSTSSLTYNHDIQICLDSYADKTAYHPYKKDVLELPEPVTLRSAGTAHDVLVPETGKITRNVGVVDLGNDLDWSGNTNRWNSDVNSSLPTSYTYTNVLCGIYTYNQLVITDVSSAPDKTFCCHNNRVYIKDTSAPDATTLKNNLKGSMLYFGLATPTTENIEPLVNPYIEVEGGGTIRTVQDQTPEIDSCLTVTYVNKVTA